MTQLDLRIVEGAAKAATQWHQADGNRKKDFIKFATPIWEKYGFNAESMTEKVLADTESPFEHVHHWDKVNRRIIYSYLRWYMGDSNTYIINENDIVGDRHKGSPFVIELEDIPF